MQPFLRWCVCYHRLVNYGESLAKQLSNPDGYLYAKDSDVLSSLDGMAHDAFDQRTSAGQLMAVVIWHQLAEEILRILYRYSQLLSKASLYPVKIDEISADDRTLGQLLRIHATTVVFDRKANIRIASTTLNSIRQQVAHEITRHSSEIDILGLCSPARDAMDSLFEDWRAAMRWFYSQFDRCKQNDQIAALVARYIPDKNRL